MSDKRTGLLLPEGEYTAVDTDLFARREAARGVHPATFEQLRPSKERLAAAEATFLESGCQLDIDLRVDPVLVDMAEIHGRIERLRSHKSQLIFDNDTPQDIKQAYRWSVNENIANLLMIQASAKGDMRTFRQWNRFVYGEPDEDICRAALDWICNDAEMIAAGDNIQAAEVALEVLERFGEKRGDRELLIPDPETFEAVRNDHFRPLGFYALLLAGTNLPHNENITPANGDASLQHIITNNLQSTYKVADAPGVTWSLAHDTEEARRPTNHNLPYKRYVGLGPGHEVGSHLLEKMNGMRGPILLASTGLDRTDLGNEGRAIIREQVMYDTFEEFAELLRWRDILRRDIAVALGEGVCEERPQRFSEVYRAINMIDRMYALRDNVPARAHARSWALVTDTLMGTDGKGGANFRRKVYLEGNVGCWRTAQQSGPRAIGDGDLGKYDINNPRHLSLLRSHGLLPVPDA